MPIFVTVMLALCNACWDLVLSRAAMLIKHVLCLVLPTDTTVMSPVVLFPDSTLKRTKIILRVVILDF